MDNFCSFFMYLFQAMIYLANEIRSNRMTPPFHNHVICPTGSGFFSKPLDENVELSKVLDKLVSFAASLDF